jgi:hypothetical protein
VLWGASFITVGAVAYLHDILMDPNYYGWFIPYSVCAGFWFRDVAREATMVDFTQLIYNKI